MEKLLLTTIKTTIKKPESPHSPLRKGGMGGFGEFMYLNAVVIKVWLIQVGDLTWL